MVRVQLQSSYRVSFDSNAWEAIFASTDDHPILHAVKSGRVEGFLCETGFRIEAVRKQDRPEYFATPHMRVPFDFVERDGRICVRMSMGPDDSRHPGLPAQQVAKFERAIQAGIRVMRGCAWMGLPVPAELRNPALFATDPDGREQRHLDATYQIDQRGVGKASFDAAGGWELKVQDRSGQTRLSRACAEWADGELVAAHIAYENDILCTNDKAKSAGRSVFDAENRHWLQDEFGVVFMTVEELVDRLSLREGNNEG